jgi:hypothetical protein
MRPGWRSEQSLSGSSRACSTPCQRWACWSWSACPISSWSAPPQTRRLTWLYYLVFYRSQLIPRWLSVWGLVGTVLGLAAGLLVLFRSIDLVSGTQVVLNLPIAVQEMILAVWLIVKGFSPNAKEKAPTPTAAELHPA